MTAFSNVDTTLFFGSGKVGAGLESCGFCYPFLALKCCPNFESHLSRARSPCWGYDSSRSYGIRWRSSHRPGVSQVLARWLFPFCSSFPIRIPWHPSSLPLGVVNLLVGVEQVACGCTPPLTSSFVPHLSSSPLGSHPCSLGFASSLPWILQVIRSGSAFPGSAWPTLLTRALTPKLLSPLEVWHVLIQKFLSLVTVLGYFGQLFASLSLGWIEAGSGFGAYELLLVGYSFFGGVWALHPGGHLT